MSCAGLGYKVTYPDSHAGATPSMLPKAEASFHQTECVSGNIVSLGSVVLAFYGICLVLGDSRIRQVQSLGRPKRKGLPPPTAQGAVQTHYGLQTLQPVVGAA
jgi:hypothetical protein